MKVTRSWLIAVVGWAYFLTAIFLYVYLNVSWVNTFDVLLGFAAALVLSVWYVADRIRYRDSSRPRGKSGWVIGPYGVFRRRQDAEFRPRNLPK